MADRADGIPARKECLRMRRFGICLHNNFETVALKKLFDKYSESEKAKTGRETRLLCMFFS